MWIINRFCLEDSVKALSRAVLRQLDVQDRPSPKDWFWTDRFGTREKEKVPALFFLQRIRGMRSQGSSGQVLPDG